MSPSPSTESPLVCQPDPITKSDLADMKHDLRRALQADLNTAFREWRDECRREHDVSFSGGEMLAMLTPSIAVSMLMYVAAFAFVF